MGSKLYRQSFVMIPKSATMANSATVPNSVTISKGENEEDIWYNIHVNTR